MDRMVLIHSLGLKNSCSDILRDLKLRNRGIRKKRVSRHQPCHRILRIAYFRAHAESPSGACSQEREKRRLLAIESQEKRKKMGHWVLSPVPPPKMFHRETTLRLEKN